MTSDDTKNKINDLLKDVENELNGKTLSKEERAEEIVLTAQVYMDAMSQINANYNSALQDLLGELRVLRKKKDEVKEASKLTNVRIKLFE